MTTDHDHPLSHEALMALVDRERPDDDGAAAHLASCAECRGRLEEFVAISDALKAWSVEPAPASLMAPKPVPRADWSTGRKLTTIAAGLALLLITALAWNSWRQAPADRLASHVVSRPEIFGEKTPADMDGFATIIASWASQPRVTLPQQTGARVIVTVFMDWLCLACKGFMEKYQPIFGRYQREHPGDVAPAWRDWPLDRGCNPHVSATVPGHGGSCAAALAVRVARDRGKAREMIQWLFDNTERLSAMTPAEATEAIKQEMRRLLGIDDIDAAVARVQPSLDANIQAGARAAVSVTPTVFINGVRVPMTVTPVEFDAFIAEELKLTRRIR